MPIEAPTPRPVYAAGVLVALQGLAGVAFALALLISVVAGNSHPGNVLGEAGYFALVTAGVLTVGIGLLRGRRWARSPAVVVQLLLLGVAWYLLGPSGQPLAGVLLGVLCLAVLVLLFTGRSRAWAEGTVDAVGIDDKEDAPSPEA